MKRAIKNSQTESSDLTNGRTEESHEKPKFHSNFVNHLDERSLVKPNEGTFILIREKIRT